MVSTDHAQTGKHGRRSGPNSNRLMPPPRFSHVRAVDPTASAPDSGDQNPAIGGGWDLREGHPPHGPTLLVHVVPGLEAWWFRSGDFREP